MKKPTRTISGVTPIAVMLPPRRCNHGTCVYCPSLNSPQSYTPESPAVLRASSLGYDAKKQVLERISMLEKMGHPTEKIELIIMGGTFLQYPEEFQYKFIKECFDAMNGKESKTLEEAKKLNETSKHRCVALCIETRPDICSENHIKKMLFFGATRVELGVQLPDDNIYSLTNRGHKVKDVIEATKNLKNAAFKVGYHIMPGCPGSNLKKDFSLIKKIFSDERFRPDQLKIYPCQVIKGSELEKWFYEKKFVPYTKEETKELLIKILKIVPRYCRVMRIMREIPKCYLVAGLINIDLRKEVEEEIRKKNLKIKEIRFREAGFYLRRNKEIDKNLRIKKTVYSSSGEKEYFLEFVNKEDIIFALLRLRILKKEKVGLIRELHVYGPSIEIGKREDEKFQHKGLGRRLLEEAEKICLSKKIKKIKIISGVGVREYYKKFGYTLDDEGIYMEKNLVNSSDIYKRYI
ncbi:MAG: tRNA uridine(34) 5-carboxymethylaminomethyl modification radical SAM/GNAT enzyme Elp3 [Candidatus Pacearchaeota archaeon]